MDVYRLSLYVNVKKKPFALLSCLFFRLSMSHVIVDKSCNR